ncbi:epidermal growth factor-like protein [Battus philenor]|uniref:epidermal growth factor-like protein n=1 Tax=Battus philenor TaxID=42288 RepID=UPI0035CF9BFF
MEDILCANEENVSYPVHTKKHFVPQDKVYLNTYSVKNQPVCCTGWQYKSEDDSCKPLCSTGCSGGHCVAPDICKCDPPAYLDEEHRNACIIPTCEPPCINAVCYINNTCKCNEGFVQHNTTHCYQCDPGYTIDDTFNCVPICDSQCVNGKCIGPNICACASGYILKDTFTCSPVCESACVNSECTAPNLCTCLEGYTSVNGSCEPVCSACDGGQCVGPEVCVCEPGYTNSTRGCVPVCDETCVNGFCSAPNLCTCNEGYVANDDGDRCVKDCEEGCEGGCDEDGKCLDCSIPFR